jgi:excisionase family DNA binding protein
VARTGDDLELLSARQVADVLHVHRSRVLAMMADGTMPSIQTSDRRRKIPRWALRDWQAGRMELLTHPTPERIGRRQPARKRAVAPTGKRKVERLIEI